MLKELNKKQIDYNKIVSEINDFEKINEHNPSQQNLEIIKSLGKSCNDYKKEYHCITLDNHKHKLTLLYERNLKISYLDNIPNELKEIKAWVNVEFKKNDAGQYEFQKNGKKIKIPVQINNKWAKSDDSNTWNNYNECLKKLKQNKTVQGIGFMLSLDDNFLFIDIDNIDINKEEKMNFLKKYNSYTELSQSKTGFHLIFKLKDKKEFEKYAKNINLINYSSNKAKKTLSSKHGDYEAYIEKRYFWLTGNIYKNRIKIKEITFEEAKNIFEFIESKSKKNKKPVLTNQTQIKYISDIHKTVAKLNDNEIIDIISRSRQKEKFLNLYNEFGQDGNSEGDQEISNILAFYTKDKEQIIRILKNSPRYREKFNRSDYLERTIEKSLTVTTGNYNPNYNKKNKYQESIIKSFDQLLNSFGITIKSQENDGFTFICPKCKSEKILCKIFFKNGLINPFEDACKSEEHIKYFEKITRKAIKFVEEVKKEERQEIFKDKVKKLKELKIKTDNNLELYEYCSKDKYYKKLSERKLEKYIYDYCTPSTRKEYNDIRGEIRNSYTPEEIQDDNFFNMQNGIYDYKNKLLLPHNEDTFFTYIYPANYNPDANSTLLYKIVEQILGSKEKVKEFKKALGYTIHKSSRFEKGFILNGTKKGCNGKDTILGLLCGNNENNNRGLFSHLSVKASITKLNDNFSHNLLENKKAFFDIDYNEKYLTGTEIIRKMISGVVTTIREPHKEPREISLNCKPWIACNSLPKIENHDGGWFRRWVILDCNLTFGENGIKKDTNLKYKLNSEEVYSTLFNWVIEGYKLIDEFKDTGDFFIENKEALNKWEKQINNIIQFIDEECILNSEYIITKKQIYNEYFKYCIESGTKALSKNNFTEKIISEYPIISKKETKGKMRNQHIFQGIQLNTYEKDKIFDSPM